MDNRFPQLNDGTRALLVTWLRERAQFHQDRAEKYEDHPALVEWDVHAMGALADTADALETGCYEQSDWTVTS